MSQESWKSRTGFILAAAGSAIGLANIWRFPYMVGANGGAAFIAVYLLCLLAIGIPVFVSEILIGRSTQCAPRRAMAQLTAHSRLSFIGKWIGAIPVITGFLIASFYSAVAGWILGYLTEALAGRLTVFSNGNQAAVHFAALVANPFWGLLFHGLFIAICTGILLFGVRRGIERGSMIMMPLLYLLLTGFVIKGLTMSGASKGLQFLLTPDWKALTPTAILLALGQSFFTLSLGQGTMITYGSYLGRRQNILADTLPVILMDTLVSIMSAVAVMTIVFSVDLEPTAGEGLIFHTFPMVFSRVAGGYFLAVGFFLLVTLAAVTSEISAMEPLIAHLQQRGWGRKKAAAVCGLGAFTIGIPCALSFSSMKGITLFGMTAFDLMNTFCTSVLVPLGGLIAVLVIGWVWGWKNAGAQLVQGAEDTFNGRPWLKGYFWFCMKFLAPILIVVVFLHALNIL